MVVGSGMVGSAASGPLRVTPAEVSSLAGEVVRLWESAGRLRPGGILDGAGVAVPGGRLGPACRDLAERWDREFTQLHHALSFIADTLRASAGGYEQVERATAASFSGSGHEASAAGEPGRATR